MSATPSNNTPIEIIDIRGKLAADNGQDGTMYDQIIAGLSLPPGQKTMPTMLLYDERGLRLYDTITTEAPEYYLFSAEERILKKHAKDIVRLMHGSTDGSVHSNEVVVELGAGALRKTSLILRALADLVPSTMDQVPITYHALDLEKRELERTLGEVFHSDVGAHIGGKVSTKGLCATYNDGLKFIQEGGLQDHESFERLSREHYKFERPTRDMSPESSSSRSGETEVTPPSTPGADKTPMHLLFLGSSLGNFGRGEDVEFLRSLPLEPGSGNTILLGLDHTDDAKKVELAYNDPKGATRDFIMNGLVAAGRVLGNEHLFNEENWEYVGKYNPELRRHEAFYKSKTAQTIVDPSTKTEIKLVSNELVRVEVSHKYSERDTCSLFTRANLRPIHRWTDPDSNYSLWLLERPQFLFPLLCSPGENTKKSAFGLPTVQEWSDMWAAWDFINRRMIPPSMLFQKPIDLRHICLFYQGHIPAFLDIHLSRLLKEPNTEPENFKYIFERGIDPNVDDPTQCHAHSEVPQNDEDWPSLGAILGFQGRVRERLFKLYDDIASGKVTLTRKIARVLWMTLEHEAFHAETLLYMLFQRAGSGTIPPSGFVPPAWEILAKSWNAAPKPSSPTVTLGPATVTLGHDDFEDDDDTPYEEGYEFGWDNEHPKREVHVDGFRIEWRPITNGEFHEFYNSAGKGKVNYPASWVEVKGKTHVRTLYGPVPLRIAYEWPIVTSYDNLSTYATVKGGRIPTEAELRLFHDKFNCGYEGGANVGYRNWHLVPATYGLDKNSGIGHNGGVWEWTSTKLENHDGFIQSKLYPGYSTDFFDNQHQVVIGGSYATIPRQAERSTVRNYFQHNYPYAWVGARIAYDLN